jgi:hypothetical protein
MPDRSTPTRNVFDAPDLAKVARINPERITSLRKAARVVGDASTVGRAANEEMEQPEHLRAERLAAAQPLFHEPGRATERSLDLVYSLLDLPPDHVQAMSTKPMGASL